jgi:hypothetical protein
MLFCRKLKRYDLNHKHGGFEKLPSGNYNIKTNDNAKKG